MFSIGTSSVIESSTFPHVENFSVEKFVTYAKNSRSTINVTVAMMAAWVDVSPEIISGEKYGYAPIGSSVFDYLFCHLGGGESLDVEEALVADGADVKRLEKVQDMLRSVQNCARLYEEPSTDE